MRTDSESYLSLSVCVFVVSRWSVGVCVRKWLQLCNDICYQFYLFLFSPECRLFLIFISIYWLIVWLVGISCPCECGAIGINIIGLKLCAREWAKYRKYCSTTQIMLWKTSGLFIWVFLSRKTFQNDLNFTQHNSYHSMAPLCSGIFIFYGRFVYIWTICEYILLSARLFDRKHRHKTENWNR